MQLFGSDSFAGSVSDHSMDEDRKLFAWDLVFASGYLATIHLILSEGAHGTVMKKTSKPIMRALVRYLQRLFEEHRRRNPLFQLWLIPRYIRHL